MLLFTGEKLNRNPKDDSFLDVLTDLGLTTNLKLCLDAGDGASYDPDVGATPTLVPQLWKDRSGGGYNFYLGADATASATDPTFNGPTDLRSIDCYFNHDGGDYFTLAQTNPTWIQNLHKDNAKWSFAMWVYVAANSAQWFFGNEGGDATKIGVKALIGATYPTKLFLEVWYGANAANGNMHMNTVMPTSQWVFLAGTIDEAVGAGGAALLVNSTVETFNSTYTTPSSSNASYTFQIGAGGNGGGIMPAGNRTACFAMWEGAALTSDDLLDVFNATKGRFGLWSYDDLAAFGADLAAFPDTGGPKSGGRLIINDAALGIFDYCVKEGNQTVSAFNSADWFTATEDSRSAVVVVDGDLTINAGQVFTPAVRKLFTCLYVTGDLTLNGEISMTARGANHSSTGSNIAAADIRIANGIYSSVTNPQVPAAGAAGGILGSATSNAVGVAGSDGVNGASGGGGSGGRLSSNGYNSNPGDGSAGTSFCGGIGGGASYAYNQATAGVNGAANGGRGGTAGNNGGTCGGGAGNPNGGGYSQDGAGGTLIIIVDGDYSGSGTITADGMRGGSVISSQVNAGGGSSGGGSVTLLVRGADTGPTPTAIGPAGGDALTRDGGKGGDGTARKLAVPPTLLKAITDLSLTTNLKLCLDAGDLASYDGSSQIWTDVSGTDTDFARGQGGNPEQWDPTFSGRAGRQTLNEYFAVNGGQCFTMNSLNPAWVQSLHKDSAKWTFAGWFYVSSISGIIGFGGDNAVNFDGNDTGICWAGSSSSHFGYTVVNAGSLVAQVYMAATIPTGQWVFVAATCDETVGAGGATLQVNGTQETFSSTYTSPSTGNASWLMEIGTGGNLDYFLINGSRIAGVMMWQGGALSAANLTAIYNATKGRFGL